MEIILMQEQGKKKAKWHIDHHQVICGYGCDLSMRGVWRRNAHVDVEETLATGHLYIQLLGEDISWWRDDEVCHTCSSRLVRIIKRGERLQDR